MTFFFTRFVNTVFGSFSILFEFDTYKPLQCLEMCFQASIILPYFLLCFLKFSFQADETVVPFRNSKLQGMITAQYCKHILQMTRQQMKQVTCVKDACWNVWDCHVCFFLICRGNCQSSNYADILNVENALEAFLSHYCSVK